MNPEDFIITRSAGPTSHPIRMDIKHVPTGFVIMGTGRDDQKLANELIARLAEIVSNSGNPEVTEVLSDADLIAAALDRPRLGRPRKDLT